MYVRWQKRKRQNPFLGPIVGSVKDGSGRYVRNRRGSLLRTRRHADGSIKQDTRWSVILVESVRVNGKPTQRHVAYLASITDSAIEVDHQRLSFWDKITERLDKLGNRISPEDRKSVEAAIALTVPRLSQEEREASIRERRDCPVGTSTGRPLTGNRHRKSPPKV
jgi:hypothetical protein